LKFVKNNGQWEQKVLYAADLASGARVFLETNRLVFVICDTKDLHERWFHGKNARQPFQMNCHSYTVQFGGANPSPVVSGENQASEYHNYFLGNDSSHWATEVPLFQSVRYREIYPGIDYIIQGDGQHLKYAFDVKAGANPSDIRLLFEGQDGLELRDGNLIVKTSVTDVADQAPVAFQGNEKVPCDFMLNGKALAFDFPNGYDKTQPVLIDPTMVFSTYTGSFADNFGFTATYDNNGALYAGGIAYGAGYPTTTGAYDVSFNGGGFDASISKFGPTGAHLYSTYIGGASGPDQPHSMVVDATNTLYVMGRTTSADFPTSFGCFDATYNGNADIFVVRLSQGGNQLLGSTFMGGAGDDALNVSTNYAQNGLKHNYGDDARGEIVVDDAGNVYVANCTQSANFPTTAGAFRTNLSGVQDGCVFKLNPALTSLTWSTYLGGSASDAAYSLKVDAGGNVVVTGGTSSSNFPVGSGGFSALYNGGIDGFIVRINSNGSTILNGTFIGNASYNQCYFVELDDDDEVYVVGQKEGSWPVTPGVWSTQQGGQFIMKLNNTLSNLIYSTQFGTSNAGINISPTAFLVDNCEYVYVSGWGGATNFEGSTAGLPVTADAFQSSTHGSDLYIIVLEKDAQALDYATFIGGTQSNEHVDGGTSRFNKEAEIYQSVCAGCWSNSDFPTTSNAYSNSNNSSGCNLACFKMELNLPGVRASFSASPTVSGCAPLNVQFTNNSIGAVSFNWNFGDPLSGTSNSSSLFAPTHLYTQPGVYVVTLIATDPNACNIADTSFTTITVFPPAQAVVSPDTSICRGQGASLTATGGQSYNWSPSNGLSGVNGNSVTASPSSTTTYTVEVIMASGCRDTGTVTVTVLPSPTAIASADTRICPGDSALLTANGGLSYAWSNGTSLSNPTASSTWAFPSTTTQYVVTVTDVNGCTDTEQVRIEISNVQAQAGPDVDLCEGNSTTLNGTGGGSYNWSPPVFLSATNIPNPTANPPSDITYFLEVTNADGCTALDSVRITLRPLPVVDAGPDMILCELDTSQVTGFGALNYQWTPAAFFDAPASNTTLFFPTIGGDYYLLGTNQWGCRDLDTFNVQLLPAPVAVAGGPSTVCEDSTAQLSGSGGGNYNWAPSSLLNDPTVANPIATLQTSTTFTLQVTSANGCDNFDTIRIAVTPTPVVQLGADRVVCEGSTANIFAFGGQSVSWSTGDTTRRLVVSPDSSTWYVATAIVEGCPSLPDSILLTVDTLLPLADFVPTPDSGMVPLTVEFQNFSTGANSYQWFFDDGGQSSLFQPSHTYLDTGVFYAKLVAMNSNGCTDTLIQRIIVGVDFTIYVPNAFTPNGDGINDYFNTPWIGVKDFHVMIFDRWGMLIYESRDPDFRWYGDLHDAPCQEGVYTYVIEARGYLSKTVKRAGTVTLYR
jgi:gliding motility-associated-like protein